MLVKFLQYHRIERYANTAKGVDYYEKNGS